MSRVSYNLLPVEGPKFPRDVSRIVNQAMSGQQNCVFDFTVPAGAMDQPGETFRVEDIRISQQKYLDLAPLNTATRLADVVIVEIGNGFFDIQSFPEELLFAQAQVSATAEDAGSLFGGTKLPLDSEDLNVNFTVDLVNDRVISKITGGVVGTFSVSGAYATGTNYDFGIATFDNVTDQNLLGTFTVGASTSNQNDVISAGGTVLFDLVPGNYVELFGEADTVLATFIFDASLAIYTNNPNRGTPVLGELSYRCLVIG